MSMDDGRDDVRDDGPDDGLGPEVSRRDALKKLGVAAGVAWSAPVVLSFFSPAGAAGTPPPTTTTSSTTIPVDPECRGATCVTFLPCSSTNPDCVCATLSTDEGLCFPGSTPCVSLDACGPDFVCPPGFVCALDSCCGPAVCIPVTLANQCPPGEADGVSSRSTRVPTGAGTFAG